MRRFRSSRSKIRGFFPSLDVQAWLNNNSDALISCPNQPGNLRLMPAACARRHLTANETRWSVIGSEPFHQFIFKMNLVSCRTCALGAHLAARHHENAA